MDRLGVARSYEAVWNWKETLADALSDPPQASPSRVEVDVTQIEIDGDDKWLDAAIDTKSQLLFGGGRV